MLPGPLHGVAACYAIGLFIQRASDDQALTELKRAVAQMQLLLVQARLAQT